MVKCLFYPCHPFRVHGLILRSKSGHNGRVIQGPWNQRGNSWTSQITSILMGKHDIGPFWPLPPSLPVHGRIKNGWFLGQNQVTMAGSSREPAPLSKKHHHHNKLLSHKINNNLMRNQSPPSLSPSPSSCIRRSPSSSVNQVSQIWRLTWAFDLMCWLGITAQDISD